MLPEGWKLSSIGEHIDLLSGFAFKSEDYISEDDGIKLLRGDNVSQSRLRWRDVKRYPQSKVTELSRYQLKVGDFVIAMDRTWIPAGVKVCEVVAEDLPCLLVQRVARLRALSTIRQDLLRQYFAGNSFEQYVQSVQTETAVPHISPTDIRDFEIALPPIAEQRRIAEILSTWDRAIAVQERLVANARAQKKALMQTLLTGKKRLPGFKGEWRKIRLGQLGEFRRGSGILRDQVLEAGFPCIRYGEIYTTHHDQIREFASYIDSESALEAERLVTGDLLFTCSGETAAEIGKCVAYLGSYEAYAGGDIILLNPTGHNSLFMSYVLNSANVIEQKRKFGQGNSVVHISAANLAKLSFKTPARSEQDAIATTIDSVSDLIRRGEDDLAKMKLQKSALMQQLLTGKRRVKVEAIER